MEKEFIPYEQALALKELGFDEKCLSCYLYEVKTFSWELNCQISNNKIPWIIAAPLYQQAFRWFREKYGYDVSIKKCTPSEYKFEIEQLFAEGDNYYFIDFVFKTYEVAELECLKKLVEIVKRK